MTTRAGSAIHAATLAGVALLGVAAAIPDGSDGRGEGDGAARDERGPATPTHRQSAIGSPLSIRWGGWKSIISRTFREVSDDRIPAVAGGVVYFGLLAIFPTLAALSALYGLVVDRTAMQDHILIVSSVLPDGLKHVVSDHVHRLVNQGDVKLGSAFLMSFALALWSANAGTKAVIEALNVAYGEREKRSFVRLTSISLFLTLAGVLAVLVAIGCVVVLPLLFAAFGLGGWNDALIFYLRWPALVLIAIGGFSILYRYAPSRASPPWSWVLIGATFATLAWLIASSGLSIYLSNFANFEASYGALGGLIAGLLWMWISILIFLVGAELNGEIEREITSVLTDVR